MLSTIRHFQKGVLIAVAVIVVISFAFFGNPGDPGRASDSNVINVNGEAISSKEARKLRSAFNILLQMGMSDFAIFLYGADRQDTDYTDFAVNITLFRDEAKKLGIQPTPEQIRDAASNLPAIAMNQINQKTLERQILKPNGYTASDFFELVSDYVAFKQVRSLLNSGIEPLESEIESYYEADYVTVSGSLVKIPREPFVEKAKAAITDEEIADYHTANAALYQSEAKRAVDLIRFKKEELKEDATNEEKATADLDYARVVDKVTTDFENDGSNFDEVVKKHELKVEALEAFSATEPPESLKEDTQISELVFSPAISVIRPVSGPVKLADGSYIVLRLREDLEPAPLDLATATPQIKEALLDEKVRSLLDAAVAEARAKITEALDAGKSITEAAKAGGYEATVLPAFSSREPPKDVEFAGQITQLAGDLNPGKLSASSIDGEEESVLVYVAKKELIDSPEEANRKSTVRTNLIAGQTNTLMRAWFRNRVDEAEIFTHYRIREAGDGEGDEDAATESGADLEEGGDGGDGDGGGDSESEA